MPRPGVQITSTAARPARGEPTDTGVAFVADFAEKGPHDEAVKVTSLDDFTDTFGARVAYSNLHDWLETFFEEGGAEAYVGREVGPDPVLATLTLEDGEAVDTLRIDAESYGDWANGATGGIDVQVQAGTDADTFRILVYLDDDLVETHDNLTMDTTAARYAPSILANSDYVRGTDLNSATVAPDDNPAVLAQTALASGTDDHSNATQSELDDALALFAKDLGPGQVSVPGRSSQGVHEALVTHAAANNRTAYLDADDQETKADLLVLAGLMDDYNNSEYAGLFGSWVEIPGVVSGTRRAVPGSAYAAAVSNRVDSLEGNAGTAPAGEASRARYVLGVSTPTGSFTDDDYEDLNDAGVNMMRAFTNRGIQLYGFRSVTSQEAWISLTHNRLRTHQVARLENVGLQYVFKPINAPTISDFKGALVGEMLHDYNEGILGAPGDTPEEAFRVDTDPPINTAATAEARELNAKVYAKYGEFAELVAIGVIKVPLTASVGG